jgi:hypothetical protein
MSKTNITNYMTNSYSNISTLSIMQKQSQFKAKTNPIKANLSRRSLVEGGFGGGNHKIEVIEGIFCQPCRNSSLALKQVIAKMVQWEIKLEEKIKRMPGKKLW